jgi:DNA-binding SARP family transcriptional activator/Tfp pilus assembly protein PilF
MWFAILGPLQAHDGETPVDVPKGRQRALLAALMMHAGSPVSAGALTEMVWDGSPPPGADVTLRSHVLRLRRVLGPRAGARLVTRHPGYLLQASEDEVDALRFRSLCQHGGAALREGAWASAEELLGEALGLWRGAPLADIPSESLHWEEVRELEELRLQAQERRNDAALHLGHHDELVTGLQSLAAQHPLRERFHSQLMLALYRCGRQAEALTAYQHARNVLVNELGTEPGPELRQLHQRILTTDQSLAMPRPATSRPSTAPAVPRQLPAAVAHFVGRRSELAALTAMLDHADTDQSGTVVISAVSGMAGVGKTALALHWAHQAAPCFSDGQLYVNLRGFGPSGDPVAPHEAIGSFLDALGVAPDRIPAGIDARAGLYRSLLSGRQMLIVLDNAHDEQQVRPLLPAASGCLVIITSRSQLAGLSAAEAAHVLPLDALSHAEAHDLLTARLGTGRAAADPGAAGEIADLCGRLPLALTIAAARAATRPCLPFSTLVGELREAASCLDVLSTSDPHVDVRSVFSWSVEQLSPPAARLFRLLGLHPGPDVTVPAAASLAGVPAAQTRHDLAELTGAHLITEHAAGRYSAHDLLHAYAAEQARTCETESGRDSATGRLLGHYLHTARAANTVIRPALVPELPVSAPPGVASVAFSSPRQAWEWFEAEHHVLFAAVSLAAETGFDACAWQLPSAMATFLDWRGRWQEWIAAGRTALKAATRLGDETGQARATFMLGLARIRLADHDRALLDLQESLDFYRQLGDLPRQARVHQSLCYVAGLQGRRDDALGHAEQALTLSHAAANQGLQAQTLNNLGWCHAEFGDYQRAQSFCKRAIALNHELGRHLGEAHAWDSLGYTEYHLGWYTQAVRSYQRAIQIFGDIGDQSAQALTLARLGDTHHTMGDPNLAHQTWRRALALLESLHHPNTSKIRAKLSI